LAQRGFLAGNSVVMPLPPEVVCQTFALAKWRGKPPTAAPRTVRENWPKTAALCVNLTRWCWSGF